jgi:hypothetical protein
MIAVEKGGCKGRVGREPMGEWILFIVYITEGSRGIVAVEDCEEL